MQYRTIENGTGARTPGEDVPEMGMLSSSPMHSGGQNEGSRDASKCGDSQGHDDSNIRDTK